MIHNGYAAAGVNIDAGNRAVELMKAAVKSTYGPEVLGGIGSFGGLYDISALKAMKSPVLVASTDGVGTKVKIAAQAGRYTSIGYDIVNHCIDDILVQGARPLFFLDYFATSSLNPQTVAEVVGGISDACRAAGCALIGGETAEMPGVYMPDEFDIAGTIVGVVDRAAILPGSNVCAGDLLVGVRSSGAHTNGYSLIRKVFEEVSLEMVLPESGITLVDALLTPHRSYYPLLFPLHPSIKAMAHLTGGGFIENIPRVLPRNVNAIIDTQAWKVPELFRLIQARGRIEAYEMYRVFNMGIGMVLIVDSRDVASLQESIPEETYIIGKLVEGNGKVILEHVKENVR
ncbi:MAG TPA: phosphoribosylformylglycinamidine cyclo-ligase [Anaerolineales bacterium]|nr:phosphoribosylformylglycinamidine cyclo-ligase [Anaerolineales bacterium]